MKKIILASSSPRRKQLLENIGVKFEVCPSNYEEDMTLKMSPVELAKHLSLGKAEDVAKKYSDAIIISADTIVALGNDVFGKPKDDNHAKEILRRFSGKPHSVISGFTIIDTATGKKLSKAVETKVYFKDLSDSEIDSYVATENVLDKGGAYAIQGLAAIFIKKIEGDYFNIVGLPIFSLTEELKNFGIKILQNALVNIC